MEIASPLRLNEPCHMTSCFSNKMTVRITGAAHCLVLSISMLTEGGSRVMISSVCLYYFAVQSEAWQDLCCLNAVYPSWKSKIGHLYHLSGAWTLQDCNNRMTNPRWEHPHTVNVFQLYLAISLGFICNTTFPRKL